MQSHDRQVQKLAVLKVTAERIQLVFSFHVFTLPLIPEHQLIDSLPVRFA